MRYIVLVVLMISFYFIYQRGEEEIIAHDESIGMVHYHSDLGLIRASERCRRTVDGYLCQAVPARISQKPF